MKLAVLTAVSVLALAACATGGKPVGQASSLSPATCPSAVVLERPAPKACISEDRDDPPLYSERWRAYRDIQDARGTGDEDYRRSRSEAVMNEAPEKYPSLRLP